MTPAWRKLALTVHLTLSVGWIGAVLAYLAVDIAALTNGDAQMVRAAYLAMELIGWWAIVPLAVLSLLTGLVMALGTPWGLFRHYWVLISFLLTTFATAVLVLHMPDVNTLADIARRTGAPEAHGGSGRGDLLHAGGGLVVLLVITTLNIYKPRGMTPYGWRRRREELLRH